MILFACIAHLLEFLDARDVAQLLLTRTDAVHECGATVWHWLAVRVRHHLPGVELPRQPPPGVCSDRGLLIALLRRLHVAMTCKRAFVPLLAGCSLHAMLCDSNDRRCV